MNITPELKQQMSEALGQKNISNKTARDIYLMCTANISAREALALRGLTNPCPDTLTDLKQKSEKFILSCPEIQNLAQNATKAFLQGQPIVGEYKDEEGNTKKNYVFPKASTVGALIKEVGDRTDPVKGQQGSGPVNLFVNNLQVNQFQAQDIVGQVEDESPQVIECK